MADIPRRTILKGAGAAALAVALPVSASAVPVSTPVVAAVPSLRTARLVRACKAIAQWHRYAETSRIPREHRVFYQHLVGGAFIELQWHYADAVHRVQTVGDIWPALQFNVDKLKALRAGGQPEFSWADWDFRNVRIGDGPLEFLPSETDI